MNPIEAASLLCNLPLLGIDELFELREGERADRPIRSLQIALTQRRTRSSSTYIPACFSKTVSDDLRFSLPDIPPFYARRKFDIRHTPRRRRLNRSVRVVMHS